jgi:flagellar basal body-associated protein FliL
VDPCATLDFKVVVVVVMVVVVVVVVAAAAATVVIVVLEKEEEEEIFQTNRTRLSIGKIVINPINIKTEKAKMG